MVLASVRFYLLSSTAEFDEAEITRAIGILRTNGMKLDQVISW